MYLHTTMGPGAHGTPSHTSREKKYVLTSAMTSPHVEPALPQSQSLFLMGTNKQTNKQSHLGNKTPSCTKQGLIVKRVSLLRDGLDTAGQEEAPNEGGAQVETQSQSQVSPQNSEGWGHQQLCVL